MPRGNAAGSRTTRATLGLRELIFDGELAPGERVAEVALAERLRVSRTPLRVALTTLAHEGLLEPISGGGFVVRRFTRDEVADAIEIRGVLEGAAARFAAERLESDSELADLRELSAQLDEVVRERGPEAMVVRFAPLNEAFHAGIAELSKSTALQRQLAYIAAFPFASPNALLASHSRLDRGHEILAVAQHQHRVLIEAIGAGHGMRAAEVAHEHARLAQLTLELVLSDYAALGQVRAASLLRAAS
jgi:GntR family transcriptional regulator, vanillate catabolism transcriptional regulator